MYLAITTDSKFDNVARMKQNTRTYKRTNAHKHTHTHTHAHTSARDIPITKLLFKNDQQKNNKPHPGFEYSSGSSMKIHQDIIKRYAPAAVGTCSYRPLRSIP